MHKVFKTHVQTWNTYLTLSNIDVTHTEHVFDNEIYFIHFMFNNRTICSL